MTKKFTAYALVGLFALGIAGCAESGSSGSDNEPASVDKYTQTWEKDYSETTCDDWNDLMSNKQQWAASADILSAARDKIDGGTGVAPDELIDEFQSGITNVCIVPTMTLTDASYGLYTTEPRFHP